MEMESSLSNRVEVNSQLMQQNLGKELNLSCMKEILNSYTETSFKFAPVLNNLLTLNHEVSTLFTRLNRDQNSF